MRVADRSDGRWCGAGPSAPGWLPLREARLGFGGALEPARSAQARGKPSLTAPSFPAGCLCTVSILAYGIICFKKGNTRRSQLMMRARVIAQGFTFAALLGGMVATAVKSRQ